MISELKSTKGKMRRVWCFACPLAGPGNIDALNLYNKEIVLRKKLVER